MGKFEIKYTLDIDGVKMTVPQLSKKYNINTHILYRRFKAGKTKKDEILRPTYTQRTIPDTLTIKGKTYTIDELADHYNVTKRLIAKNYHKGKKGLALVRKTNSVHNKLYVEYKGKKRLVSELARELNISYPTLAGRVKRGVTGDRLSEKPKKTNKKPTILLEYDGELYSMKDLSKKHDINYETLKSRWLDGKRGEELIKPVTRGVHRPEYIMYGGKSYTFIELSRKLGINRSTLRRRYLIGKREKELGSPVISKS